MVVIVCMAGCFFVLALPPKNRQLSCPACRSKRYGDFHFAFLSVSAWYDFVFKFFPLLRWFFFSFAKRKYYL